MSDHDAAELDDRDTAIDGIHPLERALARAERRWATLNRRDTDGAIPPIEQLLRILPSIAHRAVSPGPARDGMHGSSLAGGSGRGAGNPILAAVEAGERRGWRQPHDPIAEHGHRATIDFIEAVHRLDAAIAGVEKVLNLTKDHPLERQACDLCADAGLQPPRPPSRYGTVGGVLARPMHLCDPHYDYLAKHGHTPTHEQTRHHDRTGRWRIRITG